MECKKLRYIWGKRGCQKDPVPVVESCGELVVIHSLFCEIADKCSLQKHSPNAQSTHLTYTLIVQQIAFSSLIFDRLIFKLKVVLSNRARKMILKQRGSNLATF